MLEPVTLDHHTTRRATWWLVFLGVLVMLMLVSKPGHAQSASGVRGIGGGVGVLFGLTGPGNLYVDTQGNQGYFYTFGNNFESFNVRFANGQASMGAMMTLGPQLTIGLIQGANQTGTPVVFPPMPRQVAPLPPIRSSLLEPLEPVLALP
jgi:hypothetical protein